MANVRTIKLLTHLALAVTFTISGANFNSINAIAQDSGGHGESGGEENTPRQNSKTGKRAGPTPIGAFATTAAAVKIINEAQTVCGSLGSEYRASCLAQTFRDAAAVMRGPAFAGAKAELIAAAEQIEAIVEENKVEIPAEGQALNEDEAAPVITKGKKTYKAVKKSSVAAVNAKVAVIVAETETKLLRSAGNSFLKKVHYQKISQAVGSTKVLLRSS